jgi:tRNA(fMet)-specific endonuclease VapC
MRRDPDMLKRFAEGRASFFRTSIITRGELFYMAYNSDRVDENLALIRAFLAGISVHRIDRETAEIYGRTKAAALARFGPRERAKQRHLSLQSLGFTDNDLWIASIALRHDLIVVSSDGDFARVAEVSDLRHESWLTEIAGGD